MSILSQTEGAETPTACTEQQRVAGRLLALMVQGELAPGARLPAERELAERFGVSRRTVNLALEQLQEQGVVDQVSPRIRRVANDLAPRLRGLRRTVVVVTGRHADRSDRYGDDGMIDEALAGISEQGLQPVTRSHDSLDRAAIRHLVTQQPVGLVLLGQAANSPTGQAAARELLAIGVPVVGYTDVMVRDAVASLPIDRVGSDQRAGGRLITEHLIARGCRRILRFWTTDSAHGPVRQWLVERDAGVRAALSEAGLPLLAPPDPPPIANGLDPARAIFDRDVRIAAGFLAEHLLADEPVDAILARSDKEFVYLAAACRLLRREPGRDVLLAGYDHTLARYPERRWEPASPAATIDKRMAAIGHELVATMRQRLSGELVGGPVLRRIAPHLVTPES
jgi:DNA-binding LacI/PurR family transcriptional regulator